MQAGLNCAECPAADCPKGLASGQVLPAQGISEHRIHSARARCDRRGRELHIDYLGSISPATEIDLCRRVLPGRRGARACLERIDAALTMPAYPPVIDVESFPVWVPPIAIIVRPDQMAHSLAVNLLLAKVGVIRMSWLPDQIEQAQRWLAQVGAWRPEQQRCIRQAHSL